MASPGWFNDNANRDWPFVNRVEPISQYAPAAETSASYSSSAASGEYQNLYQHLPHATIVDFVAIMQIDAGFREDQGHTIYLYRVTRHTATDFTFEFRSSAPESQNYRVIFSRATTDAVNTVDWATAAAIVSDPAGPIECRLQPRWRACMTSGSLADLADLMSVGDSFYFPTHLWQIEPSCIQSLLDSYLRSVNLANYPRTVVTPAAGCDSSSSAGAEEEVILRDTCLVGDLQWKPGYNCAIIQDNFKNAIEINASRGSGEGEPCDEVRLYDGETATAGSPFLSGGPGCNDILKSLNGVGGRRLTITGGPGIRVFASPSVTNRLIVDRSLEDFALCLGVAEESSSASASSVGGG